MKSEFAGNKLFRGISMREIPIFVPLIEETTCQRFGLNLQLQSTKEGTAISMESSRTCVLEGGKRFKSFSECNAANVGPSWEWRRAGTPTTDEDMHVLFEIKGRSAVVISVVLCPLQE